MTVRPPAEPTAGAIEPAASAPRAVSALTMSVVSAESVVSVVSALSVVRTPSASSGAL